MLAAGQTDAELARIDVHEALHDGLGTTGAAHRNLFGDAAIAAAIAADLLDVNPRSLTFLAGIVRRGGIPFATDLDESLQTPEQAALAHGWLSAVRDLPTVDEMCARWLEAVATVLDVRQRHPRRHDDA